MLRTTSLLVLLFIASTGASARPQMVIGDQLAEAGPARQLTVGRAINVIWPSPDGRLIACREFILPENWRSEADFSIRGHRLLLVDAERGSLRVLLQRENDESRGQPEIAAQWSADGQWLAVRWPEATEVPRAAEFATTGSEGSLPAFDPETGAGIVTRVEPMPMMLGRLFLFRTDDWSVRVLPDARAVEFFAWHPSEALLAVALRDYRDSLGPMRDWSSRAAMTLWSPTGTSPLWADIGEYIPQWTPDGAQLRFGRRAPMTSEIGETRFILQQLTLDLATGRVQMIADSVTSQPPVSPLSPVYALPSDDGRTPRRQFRVVFTPGEPLVVVPIDDPEQQSVVTLETAHAGPWSPHYPLLLFRKIHRFTDEVRLEEKGSDWDLWAFNAAHPDEFAAMPLAAGVDWAVEWIGEYTVVYLRRGDLFRQDIVVDAGNPRDRLTAGLPVSEEEMREMALAQMRQIGLGLLMMADDYDRTIPDPANHPTADQLVDMLAPYVRQDQFFFAPDGTALVTLLMPPGVNIDQVMRPADTPAGFLAWPPGSVAVVFLDGRTRMFTDAEWEQFIEAAKQRGDWPPDW